jgi:hypothetical protein
MKFELDYTWNRLVQDRYKKIKSEEDRLFKSTALPGMWIPVEALKKRDWWSVIAKISQGITRRGHRDFMATIWRD